MDKNKALEKLDACFNTLLDLVSDDSDITEQMKNLIDSYKDKKSIDQSLLQRLKELATIHKTPFIDKYDDLMHQINNNSIIIYFKSANVFRVYDATQISTDLTNQLNNDFRREKQMYELIPNNLPQKIIILCDKEIVSHIDTVKNYVIEYMKTKGLRDMKGTDIKTFENESGMIEIIMNKFYVENYYEREKIVSELLYFINKKEKNNVMTKKMKESEFNPFADSQLIALPSSKKSLDGQYVNAVDMLIRNIEHCHSIKNGNVYINIVQNNIKAKHVDTINISGGSINEDNSDEFITHIKNTHPEWYKPGKFVNKDSIHKKYEEFSNDEITKQKFHKIFNDKLFTDTRRDTKNNIRTIVAKLKKYEEL